MTHRNLTVTVSGATASGKTMLAAKIAQLLRDNGIGASVQFEDLEHTPGHVAMLMGKAQAALADAAITVNMDQLPRGFVRPPFTSSELLNRRIREDRAAEDKVPGAAA